MNTHLPIIALIALNSLASSVEEPPDLKKSAYQTGASQDQLRGETRRVKEAIESLREEFHQYGSMQIELSMLESAMRDLAGMEEHDMPDTSAIFKDASRLDDAQEFRKKLITGSLQQKKMQVVLREIADRLYLQRDLVMMRNRYHALALRQATNLRDVRRAENGKEQDSTVMAGPEQLAIAREIVAAGDALKLLASNGPPLRTKPFAAALAKSDEGKLAQTAEDAALTTRTKLQREVPEKAASLATLDTLKSVIAALDTGRSAEDRTRELVSKLDVLIKYQEALATFGPKVAASTRDAVIRGQAYLSDEMDLAQDSIAKLHEEAARYNAAAWKKSEDLFGRFEQTNPAGNLAAIKSAVADQRSVIADLKAARDLLQKKAEELAKENSSPELEDFMNSLEQAEVSDMAEMMEMPQEMRDLIRMLLEAKAKIRKAKEMLKEKGDPKEPREQVDQSGKDLKDADDTASQLEGIIPPEVAAHIRNAGESNGEAAEKLGEAADGKKPGPNGPQPAGEGQPAEGEGQQPGGESQQPGDGKGQQPGTDLDQAEAEIDKALEALKKMMTKSMGMGPGDMPGDGEGEGQEKGQKPGKGGSGQGEGDAPGGKGKAKRGDNTPSGIKPVETTERNSQREALMLLEKEKAPAEYEQMVDQYIRNLGKGELPSR